MSTDIPDSTLSRARRSTALLRACHPEPALAVTALATALAVTVGHGVAGSAAVAAAVLAGQLSIGWSNDALDVVFGEVDDSAGLLTMGGSSPQGV